MKPARAVANDYLQIRVFLSQFTGEYTKDSSINISPQKCTAWSSFHKNSKERMCQYLLETPFYNLIK